MTDTTKIFRALIKAKRATGTIEIGLKKQSIRSSNTTEKSSSSFLSRAKSILADILQLKRFLLDNRTIYLSPIYLVLSKSTVMNDHQRHEFESHAEQQIKQSQRDIEQLKTSIGHICFSGQRRSHYELVCAYLERELVECTKIYSEQKCLRYKREAERKKIGRLDDDDQRVMLKIDRNHHRRENNDKPKSPTSIIPTLVEQEDENQSPPSPPPPPVGTELRQLQIENEQLYHDVAQRSEEIHAISTQVVEIAQLQNDLFDNIFAQSDLIQHVETTAIATNDDLAAAIIHIRDAIRNAAQMRRWIIFFLLVMIFSLLFLDWYNI